MTKGGERIAIDSHETTPLRQSIISDPRRGRRGSGGILDPAILSRLHARKWSRVLLKSVVAVILVSWSTLVLSFRLDSISTLSTSSIFGKEGSQLRGSEKNTLYSQGKHLVEDNSNFMKLSLWLIPSGADSARALSQTGNDSFEAIDKSKNIYGRTKKVIDDLSEELGGPKFIPHITLGGASVASKKEAMELAEKLRTGLAGLGPIECSVGDRVLSGDTWNQALVFELVPPYDRFLALCRASRKILGMNPTNNGSDGCLTFPPPLRVPHMSLYYGMSPPPPSEKYLSEVFGGKNNDKKSFLAQRIMLWKTDPSSLEGVSEWEPIADITIL